MLKSTIFNLGRCLRRYATTTIREPEYLKSMYPVEGYTGVLNIQIKSFDFVVLEKFSSFVHKISQNVGAEVLDVWATPAKSIDVTTFQPNSQVVQSKYHLKEYERNVQLDTMPATLLSVLLEIVHTSLPEGVKLSVHEHTAEHDSIRYVPDLELKALKSELEEINEAKNEAKKK